MALSVSGLYSPSLEKSNSDFLGSDSTTPSPTSYQPPSEVDFHPSLSNPPERKTATASNEHPLFQQKKPPIPQRISSKQGDPELTKGRRRGQSASARPTLRLHIANPTEPPLNQQDDMQEQTMRSTMQAKAQTVQALYPRSVTAAANIDNHNRRRGETFSDFSRTLHSGSSAPGSGSSLITGNVSTNTDSEPAPAMVLYSAQLGTRTTSSSHMRITTTNLDFSAPNSSSPKSNSTPSSGSGSATNPTTTKRFYRASPLIGPQAMTSANSGTNSSGSTAPLSFFAEDSYPSASSTSASTVSTPATQESVPDSTTHFTSRTVPGPTVARRPLPVPPPPSIVAPMKAPISPIVPPPPPLPHTVHIPIRPSTPSAALVNTYNPMPYQGAHQDSSYGDLNLGVKPNDPIAAEYAYRLEKRRGKQRETVPNSPISEGLMVEGEEIPYELRSEKWKGKQKMQESDYNTAAPVPQQFISPEPVFVNSPPALHNTNVSRYPENHEVGLPPSLSGSLSNQPSQTSIASSYSSTKSSGVAGVNERGASKWKGKGKHMLKTLSISSISSLEKDSGGSLSKYAQLRGKRKEAESPASSFSSSPVVPSHSTTPPVSSPMPFNQTGHPSALVPGGYISPRISSPKLTGDASYDSRSPSPRASGWSSVPPIPMYIDPPLPLNVRKVVSPTASSNMPPMVSPQDHSHSRQPSGSSDVAPMHTHPFEADDSDEEGRRLYEAVEAVYVSPVLSSKSPEVHDRPVDTGYGYAEPGYEDDERVYIDDGYDDPNNPNSDNALDDLDREYGAGVSASGQLVSGGVGQSSSTLVHGSDTHGGFSSSRISIARERSPSPIRYARRRRDSFLEDDYDSPESNGLQSPLEFAEIHSSDGSQARSRSLSPPVLDGFVYVDRNTSPLASTATQILNSLNSRRPLSPPMPTSSSPPASRLDTNDRGRTSARKVNVFDSTQILGDEFQMSFAKNPSPTRQKSTRDAVQVGNLAVLAEDKVFVRGKWRMRSPSPGFSPMGGTSIVNGITVNTVPPGKGQGGLRRYASEESLLSAVVPSENDNYLAGNFAGFAPLRSNGFNEYNFVAPNPSFAPNRLVDRAHTPDSFDSASLNPTSSKKSISSQGHSSGGGSTSGRHTPIPRGPGSKPGHSDDFGFGTGWKTALDHGRPARKSKLTQEREMDKDSGGRGRQEGIASQNRTSRHQSAKLEKKRPVKRGLSLPRASGGGSDSAEMKRSGTYVQQRHPRALQPSEHISYDLWVERGLDQTSAAVKGKKTIPVSKI
ncbi:hypothetical protein FB446DRAFT_729174 [Lentinula raphanica]|nr:hypothetical protein FB446DRAFT_729174 [Lentinula raphanica]